MQSTANKIHVLVEMTKKDKARISSTGSKKAHSKKSAAVEAEAGNAYQ
jgi:hypothetical protein